MRFAFITESGRSVPLALKVTMEGHGVQVFYTREEPWRDRVGQGFVNLGGRASLDAILTYDPDVAVFDTNGYGDMAAGLMAARVNVIGACAWADAVMDQPEYGVALAVACGARHLAAGTKDPKMYVEGWFNGKEFLTPYTLSFPTTRLMDANIGPETESMGVVVVPLNGKPRIVSRTLGQLETVLRASDYRGPVRVQVVVREGSAGIAQVVPCLGWDHTFALFEGLRGEVGSLLHGVATGTQGVMGLDREIMLGTRLAVMPWPLGRCDIPLEETKVLGINEDNAKHLWPFGLAMRGGEYFGMGPDGALMTVTAWGSDVRAARQRVLRTIGNLDIREVMYRRDIGEGVQETLARLTSDGWLRSGGDKERAQAGSPGSRVGAGATSGNSLRHPQQTTSAIAHPPVEG